MATGQNTGLGSLGICAREGAVVSHCDIRRGWQSINPVIATTSTITSLDEAPSDAVRLPDEGQNIALRIGGRQTAGTVAVDIFLYPEDPGTRATSTDVTKNATDGNAAGQYIETDTFTTSAKTVTSPLTAASTYYVSDEFIIDRRGMAMMAIRPTAATTVIPGSGIEGMYRVF